VRVSRPSGLFSPSVRELICLFELHGERFLLYGQPPQSFPGEVAGTCSCLPQMLSVALLPLFHKSWHILVQRQGVRSTYVDTAASLRTCTVGLDSYRFVSRGLVLAWPDLNRGRKGLSQVGNFLRHC